MTTYAELTTQILNYTETTTDVLSSTITGTAQGMGAATKGGKYHWAGSKDSKW